MAQFKTIHEFLEGPSHLNHEQLYLESLGRSQIKAKNAVDIVGFEMSTSSALEKNIWCGLLMEEKFTLHNMHAKMNLQISSLVKGGDERGAGSIKHTDKRNFTFLTQNETYLPPCRTQTLNSTVPGVVGVRDQLVRKQIIASCANMCPIATADVTMAVIGERLTFKTDMKYMMLKGYLYLHDYNLGVSSGLNSREEADVEISLHCNITPTQKLLAIASYDVVADSTNLTPQECQLFAMLSDEYPCVKYAGDNVYNSLRLESSNACLINDDKIEKMEGYDFGSPDEFYNTLLNLACKLDCLEDLRVVMKEMRGIPFFIDEVATRTGAKQLMSTYPKSMNFKLALGAINNWSDYIGRPSNYYSTTKCLVSDLLIGEAMKIGIINELHMIGCVSVVGNPTLTKNDVLMQSNFRDYGYKHDNPKVNSLKMCLEQVRGCKLPLGFRGELKRLAMEYVDDMLHDKMVCTPQMNFEIPFMKGENTPWSVVRGCDVKGGLPNSPNDAIKQNASLLSLLWCMGKHKKTPKVGINLYGQSSVDFFTCDEYDMLAFASGVYRIANVKYTIGSEVKGRRDNLEVTAMSIHRTQYAGTRTLAVVDNNGLVKFHSTDNAFKYDAGETFGFPKEDSGNSMDSDDLAILTPGGSKVQGLNKETVRKIRGIGTNPKNHQRPRMMDVKVGGAETMIKRANEVFGKLDYTRAFDDTIPVPVRLKQGTTIMHQLPLNKLVIGTGTIAIDTQNTSGQNLRCGFQAVAQDLYLHGLIQASEVDTVVRSLSGMTGVDNNVEVNVLARALNEQGMGLTVIATDDSMQGYAHNYGCLESMHNVVLVHDSNHYENAVIVPGGMLELNITGSAGETSPAESIIILNDVGSRFTSQD